MSLLPPSTGLPPPPPPPAPFRPAPSGPRLTRFALVAAAVGCLAVLALVVAGSVVQQPASSATDSAALAPTSPPTASPRVTGHTVTAAEVAAGKLYLAAIAPVNTTEQRFGATWAADEKVPCRCSSGQPDQSAAMALVPSIETALSSLKDTLLKIRQQVTAISGQIDLVRTDVDLELQDFKGAYQAFTNQDIGAIGKSLDAASADHAGSEQDFVRLRFDLGLPPPPGVLPVT